MKMFGGLKVSSPPLHLCWDNYHDLWVKSSYHPLAIIARKGVERPIQPLAKKHWGPLDGKGGQMDPPCVCQSLEMHFQLRFPSQCLPHARLPTLLRMLRIFFWVFGVSSHIALISYAWVGFGWALWYSISGKAPRGDTSRPHFSWGGFSESLSDIFFVHC